MKKVRKVVLFGSDLVVSSIGANLLDPERFQLVQIDPLLPDALYRLAAASPDVVLFDLTLAQTDFSTAVLRRNPELKLVGIDMARDTMLVISANAVRLLTIDDLLHVIGSG
jgi:hypothetical protein